MLNSISLDKARKLQRGGAVCAVIAAGAFALDRLAHLGDAVGGFGVGVFVVGAAALLIGTARTGSFR